jgi:sulfite reductase (ferredoxin)
VADQLEEFVPAEDICLVAEAVKRLFDKHGNRRNKNRARLRYLVRELGFERFQELYREELAKLREERPTTPAPKAPTGRRLPAPADSEEPAEGFEEWRRCNVHPQKQAGYSFVHLPVFLGDLSSDTVEKLADIVERRGEGMVCATPAQNLIMRWVLDAELPGLHRDLSELGLADPLPAVQRELIACTGSATCRLGICLSQGLAGAVDRELRRDGIDLLDATDLSVHINGCPNSCGRHPIASIGFHGKARRVGERLSPWYVMQLGGRVGEGQTALAEGKDALAARDIPAFLAEYLRAFRESKQYPDFSAFLDDGGRDRASDIVARYKDIPAFADDKNYFFDWGAEELFSLAGRGAGECSAGVFDLIRVDLASARDALGEGKLFSATVLASRAMLVTQGEEAKDARDALASFERLFLDAGHVDASFRDLIDAAKERAAAPSPAEEMEQGVERVTDLVKAVEVLYESMDQSLRFHGASSDTAKPAETAAPGPSQEAPAAAKPEDFAVDREADFRGVTCPLNYVKTKMLLGQMKTGQVLSVLLDEEGGKSVPASAAKDGHEILLEQQRGDRWLVLLRKG